MTNDQLVARHDTLLSRRSTDGLTAPETLELRDVTRALERAPGAPIDPLDAQSAPPDAA